MFRVFVSISVLFFSFITVSNAQCDNYVGTLITYGPTAGSSPTSVTLGDDQLSGTLPIGFSFNFYCTNYSSFFISSNGYITFTSSATTGVFAQFVPNAAIPNNLIASNWTDLDPTAGGTITYETVGVSPNRKLIVNFNGISTYWGNDVITTQTILYETTNEIEMQITYATENYDVLFGSDGVTIGMENATGTIGVSPGANLVTGVYFQNQAIIFEQCSMAPDIATLSALTDECQVNAPISPTATSCLGNFAGTPDVTFPITTQGTTIVTWSYIDGNGNTATQTQTVIINDITAPAIDPALTNITAECSVASLTPPNPTDNCSGAVTITNDAILPIATQGTTQITWTYDDGNGNFSTQTQNIIITDLTAPVFDVTSLSDLIECNGTTPSAPSATDNCSGTIIGTPDVTFPITTPGTTIVTWTYSDGNGNTSTQTQNVIITTVDISVTLTSGTLTSSASPASYQWLDCDNNFVAIGGATNQSFLSPASGNFAVQVTEGGCVDTSLCYIVDLSAISELSELEFSVYPNPVQNELYIDGNSNTDVRIKLFDAVGRIIIDFVSQTSSFSISTQNLQEGTYTLVLESDVKRKVISVVKID